jgi:hypothetical protein
MTPKSLIESTRSIITQKNLTEWRSFKKGINLHFTIFNSNVIATQPHSKNWSVVSTLITAQKQCLGKCRFNTKKYLFKWENDTYKCENDTYKCENDTSFILSSVGNDTYKCRNKITPKSIKKTLKESFPTLDKINGVSFSHLKVSFSHLKRHLPRHCFCAVMSVERTLQFLLCMIYEVGAMRVFLDISWYLDSIWLKMTNWQRRYTTS